MFGKFAKKLKEATGVDVSAALNSAQGAAKTMRAAADQVQLSAFGRSMSRLQWDWTKGSQSHDQGTGRVLRNWDVTGRETPRPDEVHVSWAPQAREIAEYHFFIGWSGWATECLAHDGRYFSPRYVQAMVDNKLDTVRQFSVPASELPVRCLTIAIPADAEDFYYLKIVGRSSDGSCHDVTHATLAGTDRRTSEGLEPRPDGTIPTHRLPAGSRSASAFETELAQAARR